MKTTNNKPPYPRVPTPRRWQSHYHGGHCTECGGTGRNESGCSPCEQCKGHGHTVNPVEALIRLFGGPSPDDPPTHKHKCDGCGFIWEHETDCVNNTKGHTCTKCGQEQWFWYKGDGTGPFLTCAKTS